MYRRIAPILLAALMSACATRSPGPEPTPAADQAAVEPASQRQRLEDRLLFHVLSGELAGSQGDLRQSLQSYLEASRLSDDPRLAEQAARLALYLRDQPAVVEAATRWQQLAPESQAPHEALTLSLLRSGNVDAAVEHLRVVVRLETTGAGSAFERVASLLGSEGRSDAESALAAMRALVAEHDDEPQAHQALAELALKLNQPELAVASADRAKALDPNWTAPDLLKVRAYLNGGNGKAAVALLEDILRRQPGDEDIRLQYAQALLGLEQTESALQQFELLLKSRPKDAQIRYVAALLALELGQYERARKYLLQLVNSGQRTDEAYFYLGRLAQVEKDAKGALRWYRQVQGEHRPDALLRVADLLAEQGQPAAAYAQLKDIRRQYPSHAVQSYLVEADLLREEGRTDDILTLYDAALTMYPDNADLRYGRALTSANLGRVDEAEHDLRQLLENDPENAHVLNALGYTLVDQTPRREEGFELIQQAYALSPDDPAIIDSMGWALYRLDRLDEARDMLRRAYELNQDGEIAAHLAEVLWRTGDKREAKRVLAAALKREPSHKVLLDTKKRLQ